jgi:hypothetical protein
MLRTIFCACVFSKKCVIVQLDFRLKKLEELHWPEVEQIEVA